MSCPGIIDTDFLQSVLGFADCQAQTIGMQGYQALAAPGSPVSLLLSGFLTLFIAFFGYRMLLGHPPDAREGVLAFVKIGLVLALATSWAAYRVVIYDVALHAPAELVSAVGSPAGLPGADGGLAQRLGAVDRAMVELSRLGMTGGSSIAIEPVAPGNEQAASEASQQPQPQPQYSYEPGTIFGSSSLGTARLVFLTATIASYVSVRLIAGLLLAIGPFFIAFLMFDGTRSLFEGWMRALLAATTGALAVTMMLGIELALLEPWLADLLARRHAGLSTAANSTELLVVGLAFAIALVAAMGMAARLALAFRLPFARQREMRDGAYGRDGLASPDIPSRHRAEMSGDEPSRAMAVAEAVAATQRREARGLVERDSAAAALSPQSQSQSGRAATAPGAVPLGQSYRRRAQNRLSVSAGKRDIGS